MTDRKHAVIIGGGLSGLATAIPLAEEGFRITVLERKPFLGGRASSYPVPGTEEPDGNQQYIDNCQHVLLKSNTNLINFYERIGSAGGIVYSKHITFLDQKSRRGTLRSSLLPAPLHLLPSFLAFQLLRAKDKLGIAYGVFSMMRSRDSLAELDRITMINWLRNHHQTDRAVELFWRTILVSALNEDIEIASARYGIKVFLDGLLRHREAFHMGIPSVPLSRLYTEPSVQFLNRHGKVLLRSSVDRIDIDSHHIRQVSLKDGSTIEADYYVSSVPPDQLLKLLPVETVKKNEYFSKLRQLETSPITSIYLWFDREIVDFDSVALPGREMQWIFRKKGFPDPYIGLVVSASRKLISLDRNRIIEMALQDLNESFPSSLNATLLRGVVIKEPFATFSCRAGADAFRPDQKSPFGNLFVAGDWTQTGWPATMEGAVRSGYRVAELILQAERINRKILQPDLPKEGLAKLFPF